ncbi:MAG: hypothetical protein ABJE95_22250 [Byssovorax sp.]
MLSKELMGVLALAILWVNTLLIAAAAAKEIAALLAWKRRLIAVEGDSGVGLVRARVTRGAGPGGALAVQRVEQLGRAATNDEGGRRVIHFADRSAVGEVFGGTATRDDGEIEIAVDAGASAEVWVPATALAASGSCASDEVFDRAFADAKKARGFARAVEGAATGEVYLFGQLRPMGKGLSLAAAKPGGLLVAKFDPRPWLDRKIALAVLFIVGDIALAAACSAVALWPPRFGLVSTLGGAACLGFFLTAQPAGTALRDAVRVPSRAWLRGKWIRSAPVQEPAAPPHAPRAT